MARKVRDATLDSREARGKLKPRGKPYWRTIERGLHLGYRRLAGKAGTWWARHYLGDQAYEVESIGAVDDLSDADGVAVLSYWQAQTRARERMVSRAHVAVGKTGPYTVNRAADDYLDYLRSEGRSDAAIKDASYRIEAFIRPTLGRFEVAALKPDQLRRWRADLAKAGPRLRTKSEETQQRRKTVDDRARKATANRNLTTLKAALNHAFDEERVASNKAWGRRVKPFEDVETARVRYLQIDEAKRLINACDAQFRPMVEAALQTGARYSELTRLKVADFDRDAGTVFIQLSKGGKARHVILSDEGVKFFRQACAGRANGELIFRKSDGGEWLKSHQARPMVDACKRARITPPIGFHGLRHTWASLSVKSGAPLHVVAKNLGHVTKDGQPDVRMVTRHYAHFEESYVADTIRKHAPKFGFKPDRKVATLTTRA
jgi:integrase